MPLKRSTSLKPSAPLKRSSFARVGILASESAARLKKARKPMKSKGMKGRAPTADEQRFMDAIAALGCVACRKDGITNPWISIHHIDGRTKPGAHLKVLPLCAGHHQEGTGEDKSLIAVHPTKARFEARYGTQYELLAEAKAALGVNE